MKLTIPAAGLAWLATAQLGPARATDMPSNLSVEGEYTTVSMFLDDRILESRQLVDDCKQETRDWAKALEADEKAKLNAAPGEVAQFGRRYDVSSIVGIRRYFSIVRHSGADIDGVYNWIDTDTLLWDNKANKRITPALFFGEIADGGPTMTALRADVVDGLTKKIAKYKSDVLALEPSLTGIGPASLAPSTIPGKSSGLKFHYALPVPGRFARTNVVIFVPWTKFWRYLSPRGRAVFGGSRRERDDWLDG